MNSTVIAIDVDGTLINSGRLDKNQIVANENIRTLLITLAGFKNTKIMVWSVAGETWACQVVNTLGLQKYVDSYATKNLSSRDAAGHPEFEPDVQPDIAIDDIQSCELGKINLIVREK